MPDTPTVNTSINIMTYNILTSYKYNTPGTPNACSWDSRKDVLIQLIESQKPDILVLQETNDTSRLYLNEQTGLVNYVLCTGFATDANNNNEATIMYYRKDNNISIDATSIQSKLFLTLMINLVLLKEHLIIKIIM